MIPRTEEGKPNNSTYDRWRVVRRDWGALPWHAMAPGKDPVKIFCFDAKFRTHGAAIAYADSMARKETR